MTSPRRSEHILPGKGRLILTKELLDQIDYLHNQVGKIEWCGILFYRHIEGDINDPKSLVLQAEHIYPMDIGSEAYTEADIDIDAVIEMDDVIPDVRNLKKGLIHTHHTMRAFFSGTDMAELHDSTPFHNFYLSLIVNFSGEYVARVAYIAKKVTTLEYRDAQGVIQTSTQESELLAQIEMDIEWESQEPVVPDYFRARHEVLKQKKAAKVSTYRSTYTGGNVGFQQHSTQVPGISSGWNRPSFNWDKQDAPQVPGKQGTLFATEKNITKDGTLKVGDKEYKPWNAVEKDIREKITDWLDDGITNFTQGVNPGTSVESSLRYLKDYFDQEMHEPDYPFFINQMQRAMLDTFAAYHPGLVSTIGTKVLDGFDDNDVCTDLFTMFDAFEEYTEAMVNIQEMVEVAEEPKKKKERVNKRVK